MQVVMEDGTQRRTLATATNMGIPELLPPDVQLSCPGFSTAADQLRSTVDTVGIAYAAVLDRLLYGSTACSHPSDCFSEALQNSESLEHFHMFVPSMSPTADSLLPMHSDIGLFLVMTAAELFDINKASAGGTPDGQLYGTASVQQAGDLRVELQDGRIVAPVLPEGSLLVMNGEGLLRWMPAPEQGHVHPYSPLHGVISSNFNGRVRAWFGRMFMPAYNSTLHVDDGDDSSPILQSDPVTFAQYRHHTYDTFHRGEGYAASAVGCSPARRVLADEKSCGAGLVSVASVASVVDAR
jgi:hypothetical protein